MQMPFASVYRRVLSAWTAMAVRQHGLGYLIGITAIVGMTVFSQLASWRPASATAHAQQQLTGTIAYADMAGDSIRLIEPDGSDDRPIWTHAESNEFFRGFKGLDWNPDATELAFGARHETTCSNYQADIFGIRADGSGERRITNPPACADLAAFPTGSISFQVRNEVADRAVFFIYVEGAPETVPVTVSPGATELVTVHNVADFGPGVIQYVSAVNGLISWIQPDIAADIQAGAQVDVSNTFVITANTGRDTWDASVPSWHRSGERVAYSLGRGIPASIPADAEIGHDGDLLFDLAANARASYLAWSPVNDDVLLAFGGDVYIGAAGATEVALIAQAGSTQLIQGMDWLPDGSGFVVAATAGEFTWERSNLWIYDFASENIEQLTDYESQYVGYPSVSPDGNYVVFTLGDDIDAGGEMFVMALDGSDIYSLDASGFWPDWSPKDLAIPPSNNQKVYLPFVLR